VEEEKLVKREEKEREARQIYVNFTQMVLSQKQQLTNIVRSII